MPSRVVAYLSLRNWERGIANRLYHQKNKTAARDNSLLHRLNPSQLGIIFVAMVLFGVDFFIALANGASHVTGYRKMMVAEAAEEKHEAFKKKAMITDYMKQSRDGKGFVLADASKGLS